VSEDPIEAYAWFDVAAAQGHLLAVNARQHLATHMNSSDIEAGVRRSAALLAKIPPQNVRYKIATGTDERVSRDQNEPTYATAYVANSPRRIQPYFARPTTAPATTPKTSAPGKSLRYGDTIQKGAVRQTTR
jgi:hypothetical protein